MSGEVSDGDQGDMNGSQQLQQALERIETLRIWRRNGQHAPHKPLLMLYALGQFCQGMETVRYVDVDRELGRLLREYGPRLRSIHTEYPFWRLQNDGLWEVTADAPLEVRSSNTDARKSELIEKNAIGRFPKYITSLLRDRPDYIGKIAHIILDNNFPTSLHEDIVDSVGLDLDASKGKQKRDPDFRRRVLRAYGSRCCVCGYDLRLGNILAGVEAAHIKWYQAGGPDVEENGLALCTLHHKVFDLGAFSVTPGELQIVFSQEVSGSNQTEWLLGFHGRSIHLPQSKSYLPKKEFLEWHLETIFKFPTRDLIG